MQLDDTQRSQQENFERIYQGQSAPQLGTLHEGLPAWEVGYPQPAFQQLIQQGNIKGPVLDVGCGTGDTVLYLAEQGYEAWGVDFSPTAIKLARQKAAERGVQPTFHVEDALKLQAFSARCRPARMDSNTRLHRINAFRPCHCLLQPQAGSRAGRQ